MGIKARSDSEDPRAAPVKREKTWRGVWVAVSSVAAATVIQMALSRLTHGRIQVFTLFYPAVLAAAFVGGWIAGALAIGLSVLAAVGFSDALGLLHWDNLADLLAVALFVLVNCFVVWVCELLVRAKLSAEEANLIQLRETEARMAAQIDQARLAAIVESSDDAIVAKTLEGIITSWNKAAERLFGYAQEEAVGNSILLIVPPERYDEEAGILKRIRAGVRVDHFETIRRSKSGQMIPVSVTISPIRDAAGKIVGASKTARDISDRFRLEKEREKILEAERAARGQAEYVNRMKDEFLATLSHELRTPLNAILGWAQVLVRGPMEKEEVRDGLRVIERNAQAQLIEDLLDMSRIISGKLRLNVQEVDPVSFLTAAVEVVRPAADAKGIRIEAILDPMAGPIPGDPGRLQQAAWNLLANAVKFTPKGGRVQVLLQRVNSHVEVTISNTGEGIPKEFLPFMFERFRQANASTTRKHGGLGLGLAIVKQIVELHGGSVRVSSEGEGHGATFTVDLPRVVARREKSNLDRTHPTEPQAMALESESKDLAGLKVMLVDDEADTREFITRILRDCGATATMASSGPEALQLLLTEKPDVLLSDIGMPGMDGYEFITRVRLLEIGGDVPAVAITAYARSEDRTRALRAGFQGHIAKPLEAAELVATVGAMGRRAGRRV